MFLVAFAKFTTYIFTFFDDFLQLISGSSNSQDSFPGPGSTAGAPAGPAMDGYGPPYSGYPPSSQPQQGNERYKLLSCSNLGLSS